MREPIKWADAPYCFIIIPTCEICGSPEYERVRSEQSSDGTVMRKVICSQCGSPYKIVLELPETGNTE